MQLFRNFTRSAFLFLIVAAAAGLTVASAQETGSGETKDPSSATVTSETDERESIVQELAAALTRIAEYQDTLQQLKMQRPQFEGIRREMVDARIAQTLDRLISLSQSTAKSFLDKQSGIANAEALRTPIVETIASLPPLLGTELANLRAGLPLPRTDQTALEQSAVFAELELEAREHDKLLEALIENNKLAAQLGMETGPGDSKVKEEIIRGAESASTYLRVTMSHLDMLRRQIATLPRNEELRAKIAVTEKHVQVVADILRKRARRMAALDIDVSWINAQLVSATGALSTEIFSWGVITRLTSDSIARIANWFSANGSRILLQLLVFIAILAIAWKLSRLAEVLARRTLDSMHLNLSQLLQRMIVSIARGVVLALGLLIGVSQLGVSLGPLLAGLGIAGFIIGFALQDSLSNFASGLMILLYRPFDIGDVVDVSGAFGTVRQMSLVNTTVLTFDNQTLVVPNNQIWQHVIKNLTNQPTRRVDMVFGISYSDEIEKAERILGEIVASNEKVLKDPEPIIRLHELGESSVNFIVRPWVKTEDYWGTYWSITREVKLRFDRDGISIPFPQRDVHVHNHTDTAQSPG